MDEDEETWLSPGLLSTTTSASKGTQSLDSWLNAPSSAIDFSTRSALSRKLKVYSEKKARRKARGLLLSASSISLESVTEESQLNLSTSQASIADDVTLPAASPPPTAPGAQPLAHSSPLHNASMMLERARSLDVPDFGRPTFDDADFDDEEYAALEKEALGLCLADGPGEERFQEEEAKAETTQEDEEEFLSAASEFEDEELEAAHHNGLAHRSRELESLDEEPARVARQQVLGGARLGVSSAPRSSSVSPRLATATVAPLTTSTPKAPFHRLASAEITSTPVGGGSTATLPRRPGGAAAVAVESIKAGGMSVSLHAPSGHLPPRRVPSGRGTVGGGVENGRSGAGGGAGRPSPKEAEKKVNLHEDLAKIQDLARQQEEALRREVMGSLSANDVSNGENDSRLITNSKSVEFVGGGGGKKEFHSRLPTPSRRVIPVRTTSTSGGRAGGGQTTTPLRTTAPNSVGAVGPGGGRGASLALSRPASGADGSVVGDGDDGCF